MIVARFGELFLKSKPVKKRFLNQLGNNIRTGLEREGIKVNVSVKRLRITIETEDSSEEEKALRIMKRTFGLVSVSRALRTEPKLDKVTEKALKLTSNWKKGTFAARAQRITKNYPFTSIEAEREVGGEVQEQTGLKVDLDNPNHSLFLEFYGEDAYVFTEKQRGPGGLPLGVAGTLEADIKNEKDLAACWMMMKRGCLIKPIEINPELKETFEKWSLTDKKPGEPVGRVSGAFELNEIEEEGKEGPVYRPLIGLKRRELKEIKARISS